MLALVHILQAGAFVMVIGYSYLFDEAWMKTLFLLWML